MNREGLSRLIKNNGWLPALLLTGICLLLFGGRADAGRETGISTPEEQRLAAALSRMEDVGETCVLLSEKPGREPGYMGAVVICPGASEPEVRLRIVETVAAFTGLGSHQIIVQKMIS